LRLDDQIIDLTGADKGDVKMERASSASSPFYRWFICNLCSHKQQVLWEG